MGNILTERQKSILIGNILGDGYLDFDGYIGTRLYIKQSEDKKDYLFWLYEEFSNLCKSEPKQRKDNGQWYLGTRYFKEFTDLRSKFYENGVKIVPKEIGKILKNPISLAVWYMDDGTLDFRLKSHFAFSLAVNCFSVDEVQILVNVLKDNFGIIASSNNSLCRGKRYPRLYIGKDGRDKFLSLITPFIHECFSYKIPCYS